MIISITGLATGLWCCVLILLYVIHEYSYDAGPGSDRIVRVSFTLTQNGNVYREPSIPFPAAEAMKEDFPEVLQTVRLYREQDDPLLAVGNVKFTEPRVYFVDSTVFSVFDIPVQEGNRALSNPKSIVLTRRMARKYFGDVNPLGRTIRYNGADDLVVTMIVADPPEHTHWRYDALVPLSYQLHQWAALNGLNGRERQWFWTGAWTYLLLSDGAAAATLSGKLEGFVLRHFPERIRNSMELHLQPLRSIHLHSDLDNELEPNGSAGEVSVYAAIAVLILAIGCINFVNLSTASLTSRQKDISIRRIAGASRLQLILSLLGQTVVTSSLAMALALAGAELALPVFNTLVGRTLSLSTFVNWEGVALLSLLTLATGVLSGLYPAVRFSHPRSGIALSISRNAPGSHDLMRKTLVILQFAISIILSIGIGLVYSQLAYVQRSSLGFDRDNVVLLKGRPDVDAQFDVFRSRLLETPGILGVTACSNSPGEGAFVYRFVHEGGTAEKPDLLPMVLVDYDFLHVMGIPVLQGRGFDRQFPADKQHSFLLNQKAAEALGWNEDEAIGKKLSLFGPGTSEIERTGRIIGVIGNYHFESFHHSIRPLVIAYGVPGSVYAVRLRQGGDMHRLIAGVESAWKSVARQWPLEYSFLDRTLDHLYRDDQKLADVIGYLAAIGLGLAALGLFGLTVFAVERRTKEIGVRKVLGASPAGIITLLTKEYLRLVLIANLIAWPVAYVLTQRWLETFAYRTETDWRYYLLAGVAATLLAILTIASRAVRAARMNPVHALRWE